MTLDRDSMEDEEDGTRYYQIDFDPSDAYQFERLTGAVMDDLAEFIDGLPVCGELSDPARGDTLENASAVGSLDEVMRWLRRDLEADYEENLREVKDIANFKTYVFQTDLHPGALEIVTELTDKGEPGRAIMYGSRVRRMTEYRFALWSGHA